MVSAVTYRRLRNTSNGCATSLTRLAACVTSLVLHYTANEGLLPDPLPAKVKAMMDDQRWSAMMLIHESIKECLVDPKTKI